MAPSVIALISCCVKYAMPCFCLPVLATYDAFSGTGKLKMNGLQIADHTRPDRRRGRPAEVWAAQKPLELGAPSAD